MKAAVFTGLTGFGLGFALSRIGFSDWDEVHSMFTFSSWRMTFAFALAVGLLALSWRVIAKVTGATWSPRLVHPGTIAGSLLFGAGWAIAGSCPSIALVQLGEAQFGALLTLGGILGGNALYSFVHERYFRWSMRNCADD